MLFAWGTAATSIDRPVSLLETGTRAQSFRSGHARTTLPGRAEPQRFPGRRRFQEAQPELGRDDVRETFQRTCRIVHRVTEDRVEILTVFEGHRVLPDDIVVPGAKD